MSNPIDKVQSLINLSNTTTGESDRTLTSAVRSLVSGYGSGNANNDDTIHEYNQMNSHATGFLAYDYTDVPYTITKVSDYSGANNGRDVSDPLGYTLTIPNFTGGKIVFAEDTGKTWIETVASSPITIWNLKPNNVVRYTVFNSVGAYVTSGRLRPTGQLRMLMMERCYNFRDMGGWACDGGTTKYGLLLRGGYMEGEDAIMASAKDIETVKNFGILHEYDLRDDGAVDRDTTDKSDDINSSCIAKYVDYERTSLNYHKNAMDLSGTSYVDTVKVLRKLMDNVVKEKPTYFHCSAGADRTGTIAVILEALLGLSLSDIDHDYELTSFARGTGYTRVRKTTDYVNQINYINSFTGARFAEKCASWAVQAGIPLAEINAFRVAMINGNPQPLVVEEPTVPDEPEPPVEKINALTLAVNSDGTPYNGGTWLKPNTRINGSGVEGTQNGVYCTGFIPVEYGKVITLVDLNLASTQSVSNYNYCYVAFYDANKTLIKSAYSKDIYNIASNSAVAENNQIKSFKVAQSTGSVSLSNAKFVRMSFLSVGSDPTIYIE